MPETHALLSPSASSRWLHCTPCAVLESKIPSRDTVYTREGTLAHSIGEWLLRDYLEEHQKVSFNHILETAKTEGYDPDEMLAFVKKGYVERVITEYEAVRETDHNARMLVETQVRMAPFADECWGTSDSVIIGNKTIHVCDYKHGKGVRVEAEGNTQMMLYALGAYLEFNDWTEDEITHVQMTIYQPRLNHWSTATMEVSDLLRWADEVVRPAAEKAVLGVGDQTPGKWCRFCRCAAQCKALADLSIKAAAESFSPELMTDEEVAHSLSMLSVVQAWVNSVSEFALRTMTEDGRKIPGYKLVEGVSRARITDPEAAALALKERGYSDEEIYAPQTLLGLTALKKLLGKKAYEGILGPFITKPVGKPTVVPDDDPRPEIGRQDAGQMFDGIDIPE